MELNKIERSKRLFRLLKDSPGLLDDIDIMNIRDYFVLETINIILSRDMGLMCQYSEILYEFYDELRKERVDSFNSLFDGQHGCIKLNAFFFYLLGEFLELYLNMTDEDSKIGFEKSLSQTYNKSLMDRR